MSKTIQFLTILLILLCLQRTRAQTTQDETPAPPAPPNTIGEIFTPDQKSFIKQEWEKARVELDIGNSNNYKIGDNLNFGYSINYHYDIAPAYLKNYHLRLDQYIAAISSSTGFNQIGVGINANIKITFARLFDDKWEAVKSKPYFLSRMPWTRESVLNNLNPGDVVRIELSTAGSLSSGTARSNGVINSNVNTGLSRGALFITDIYRMKDNKVRMRMIGARNEANISFGISVNPVGNIVDIGPNIFQRFAERSASRWFSIDPINAGMSFNMGKRFPVDTFMTDYVFNLNKDEATFAYEEIMNSIKKLEYMIFLNFQQDEDKLASSLLELVQSAEILQQRDMNLPDNQKAVNRIFKGASTTSFFSSFINSNMKILVNLWNFGLNKNDSQSLVNGYDKMDNTIDLIYNSKISTSASEYIRDFFKTVTSNGVESIYKGNRPDPTKRMSSKAIELTDLIFTKNLDDNNLSQRQIRTAKTYIQLTVPKLAPLIDWQQFISDESLHLAYIQMKFIFHDQIATAIPPLTKNNVYEILHNLVDNYPNAYLLPASRFVNIEDPVVAIYGKNEPDIRDLSEVIEKMTNENQINKKLDLFEELYQYPLFQEIGPAILVAILPQTYLQQYFSFSLNAAANNGAKVNYLFGKDELSPVYSSFKAMLAILNDRSYDLRLILDKNNNENTSGQLPAQAH